MFLYSYSCNDCGHIWQSNNYVPRYCPNRRCHSKLGFIERPNKCFVCERTYAYLVVHHVNGTHNDNAEGNRIVICSECHSAIHHGFSKRKKSYVHRFRSYTDNKLALVRIRFFSNQLGGKSNGTN